MIRSMLASCVRFVRTHWIPIALALAWAGVLSGYAVLRHNRINSSTFDLGIKAQVIWNTWQGDLFASSVEVTHYLGDHVQLIFLALAPLFGIWADARVLLIVQAILLSLGVVPLYRIAMRRLDDRLLAGLFCIVYLLYPLLGFINRFDFHPVAFSIPFFLAAYDLLEGDNPWWASLFILLALSLREEVGLTVFAFGLYAAVFMNRWKLGLIWAISGLAWSLFALFGIIPYFRGGESDTVGRYLWLGDSPAAMAAAIVTEPGKVLKHLAVPYRASLPLKLLLPVGFLALLSPAPLLITLPSLAYNLLSETPSQSTIYFQYMAPAAAFIFIAAVQGAQRVRDWLGTRYSRIVLLPLLTAATILAWAWDNPFTRPIDSPFFQVYGLDTHTDAGAFKEAMEHLPPQADVATMMAYGPHLALRPSYALFYDRLQLLERPYGFPQSDYLLLNLTDLRWSVNARIFYNAIVAAIGRFGYEAVYVNGDVVLLQKDGPVQDLTGAVLGAVQEALERGGKHAPAAPQTIEQLGREWVLEDLPPTAEANSAQFAGGISLLGHEPLPMLVAGRPFCITLYWQATERQEQDWAVFVHLAAEDGFVQAQDDSQPVFGYYPTSSWRPGEIVADLHCFVAPPGLQEGSYTLRSGLYDPAGGQRLPLVAPASPDNAFDLSQLSTSHQP